MGVILEQVKPETAAMIASLATARGLSIDEFLKSILPTNGPVGDHANEKGQIEQTETEEKLFYETATPEEWVKAFREWAESHDPNIPLLSLEDVSRESLYDDFKRFQAITVIDPATVK